MKVDLWLARVATAQITMGGVAGMAEMGGRVEPKWVAGMGRNTQCDGQDREDSIKGPILGRIQIGVQTAAPLRSITPFVVFRIALPFVYSAE